MSRQNVLKISRFLIIPAVFVMGVAIAAPAFSQDSDVSETSFFDAENYVSEGGGSKGGVRKVNPDVETGMRLVVVEKNHDRDSFHAGLVSAERAMNLGRYDSALSLYEELYEVNKRDPNVLLGRAMAYQHLGDTNGAIHMYEELLKVKPDNIDAHVNMLGMVGQRYPAVALKRLLDLQADHPGNAGIIAQVSVMQAQLGRYEEAIRYLGVAAGMEPQNASHVFNMAVIADRTGNKTEAIRYYEQALEVDSVYGGGRSVPRQAIFERLAQLR